jgi:hypothetical protein
MRRLLAFAALLAATGCTSRQAVQREIGPLAERIGVLETRIGKLASQLGEQAGESATEAGKEVAGAGREVSKGITGKIAEGLKKLVPGKGATEEETDTLTRLDATVKRLETAVEELKSCCPSNKPPQK